MPASSDPWNAYYDTFGQPNAEPHPMYGLFERGRFEASVRSYGCGEKPRDGRLVGYLSPGSRTAVKVWQRP